MDPVAPEQPSSWLFPEARPGTSSVLPCSSSSRGFRASTRPGAIQGVWPAGYRIGLLRGLWFAPDGHPTVTPRSIRDGLEVIDPVPDAADALHEQVARVRESTRPSLPDADRESVRETAEWLRHRESVRPAA